MSHIVRAEQYGEVWKVHKEIYFDGTAVVETTGVAPVDHRNNSDLKEVLRSGMHYKHYKENPSVKSTAAQKSMDLGSAAHIAILEPNNYEEEVIILDKE